MVIITKEPKRKRKQLPNEPLAVAESPKRTKVQAQRKFAQGQGNPNGNSGSFSATPCALNTSASKDLPGSSASNSNSSKDVIVPEPIMATPPPAKDFLTYVCFQRNPVFSSLNYLGKPPTATSPSTSLATLPATSKSPPKRISRGEESEEEDRPRPGRKTKHVDAKPFIPATLTKPVENPVETQFNAPAPAPVKPQDPPPPKKRGRPPKVVEPPKSESEYETASENGSADKKRSKDGESLGKGSTAIMETPAGTKVADDSTTIATSPVPIEEVLSPATTVEPKEERITRHMAWRHSYNNTPIDPTIKRKKKTSLPAPTTTSSKGPEEQPSAKLEEPVDSEFSSDDDKPLVAAAAAPLKPTGMVAKEANKKNLVKSSVKKQANAEKEVRNKRKSSPGTNPIVATPPPKVAKQPVASKKGQQSLSSPEKRSGKKANRGKAADDDTADQPLADKSTPQSESKVKKKFLSKELEKLTGDASHTPTDFSENETKTARPTRKTKEAATIYMELIGHKLNLNDTDEEGASSMDSFPELPNVRKAQQLEDEVKLQNAAEPKKVDGRGRKKKVVVAAVAVVEAEGDKTSPKKGAEVAGKAAKPRGDNLNKSFSDSDEEPLATKITKKPATKKAVNSQKAATKAPAAAPVPEVTINKGLSSSPPPLVELKRKAEIPKRSPVKLSDAEDILNFSFTTFKSPVSYGNVSMAISTPENSKSLPNRTPQPAQEQQAMNLSTQVKGNWATNESRLSPEFLKPPNKVKPTKAIEAPVSPIDETSPQNIANLMMNPLPSKEESGKIFGIAGVTLAQSSGPQDTKCTMGKCGSIHNPSLGPAVPTEALLGETAGNKDRRKTKVTRAQIMKWLLNCACIRDKEVLVDDLADIDFSVTPKPNTSLVDSPMEEVSSAAVSIRKPEVPALQPVTQPTTLLQQNHQPITKARNLIEKFEEDKDVEDEVDKSVKQIIQKLNFEEDPPSARASPVVVGNVKQEKVKEEPAEGAGGSSAPKKRQPAEKQKKETSSTTPNTEPTTPTSVERKPIYNRRTPVYNKVAVESPQPAPLTKQNSFGAFSPENEHSVYDFDREGEETTPVKAPFRRQGKGSSPQKGAAGRGRRLSVPQRPVTSEDSPQISVALNTSAPVALHLNKSSPVTADQPTAAPANKKKTPQKASPQKQKGSPVNQAAGNVDANDSEDSEGQTIYIPLQNAPRNASGKNDQMIQGVAVKLGTDGPDGCVVMKAKLVTKTVAAVSGATITDAKTQELMKSLIAGKDSVAGGSGGKPVPVGTVQPRFKSNESAKSGPLMRCGSNSSLVSQKSQKATSRPVDTTPICPSNNTAFPRIDDPAQMVEAPVFRPTEKEFQDPMEFFERIMPIAARFGLCKVVPPASFKPECRVSDDMRFMAYNQYVHKMLHRWGPSAKELWAIRKYLATQSIQMNQSPLIGGMEVDLPRLYHTVQELGGLKEVIEKKKWARVAEEMCIPKAAQDRVTKLDDIYCKFLLPYDTLSPAERQKLFDEVEADWAKREAKARRNANRKIGGTAADGEGEGAPGEEEADAEESSDEEEENDEYEDNLMECIVKGRSMPLNAFFRIARNTMALWFKNAEPSSAEVESEFWRHVAVRDSHVCVHSGSIDSSGWGYGFPAPGGNKVKGSTCAKHPWNLKVLTNNSGSVLRSLGPVMGVTVPTLHVGMLFSACCWYRDPHGLPWIEYLHTGGSKIWYGVPDEQSTHFRTALTSLVPTHCQNKTIWLPCDTAMVPPHILTEKGVSLCRTEQEPGQFVIIFPRAYTSSLSTGYVVSESVYFGTNNWLDTANEDFKDIQESCEPTMFSLDQLIFAMAADQRCSMETLSQVEPMIRAVLEKEIRLRNNIKALGVVIENRKKASSGKQSNAASTSSGSKKVSNLPDEENECDLCRTNLFISMVRTETVDEEAFYCLQHGLMYLKNGELQAKESKLIYNYELEEVESLIRKLSDRIRSLQQQQQSQKKAK